MNALIIEDDQFLAMRLKNSFKKNTNISTVRILSSYESYLGEAHRLLYYDIILIDIILKNNSKKTGVDIIKHIRSRNNTIPIIVLSGLSDIEWLKEAFNAGANDYLVKPFRVTELELRISRWYQSHICSLLQMPCQVVSYYDLSFDIGKNTFFYKSDEIKLTKTHKNLLSIFFSLKESLISEEYLREKIWGDRSRTVERNIRIHISRLKKQLAVCGLADWICNIRGEGYSFRKSF